MSREGEYERDLQPTDVENPRPNSRSSSVVNGSSSPEEVEDDVFATPESTREEQPEKVSASDVAASQQQEQEQQEQEQQEQKQQEQQQQQQQQQQQPQQQQQQRKQRKAFSGSATQSGGIRVTFIESPDLGMGDNETTDKTDERMLHHMTDYQGLEQTAEDLEKTSGEMYFFNRDSSSRRGKPPKKFSGHNRRSGKPGTDNDQKGQDNVEQEIKKDVVDSSGETNPISCPETEFSNKDSPTCRPLSTSSSSSVEAETEGNLKRQKAKVRTSNNAKEVVSVCTQTEWSWFRDMLWYQEMMTRAEKTGWRSSRETPKSPSGKYLINLMKCFFLQIIIACLQMLLSPCNTYQMAY